MKTTISTPQPHGARLGAIIQFDDEGPLTLHRVVEMPDLFTLVIAPLGFWHTVGWWLARGWDWVGARFGRRRFWTQLAPGPIEMSSEPPKSQS